MKTEGGISLACIIKLLQNKKSIEIENEHPPQWELQKHIRWDALAANVHAILVSLKCAEIIFSHSGKLILFTVSYHNQ